MPPLETICTYSDPVRYDNTPPDSFTDNFVFTRSICENDATTTPSASSTVGFNPTIASSTNATTTDVIVYNFMSAGDVLTNLLLFVIIVMMLTKYLLGALDRIKTKRTYMQYGGGDVEVREDN